MTDASADWAAWVQAFGTIAAVLGAAWIAARDAREARRREEQQLRRSELRGAEALHASRTAALNLAILAIERVRELHVLLRDEARRDRIAWGAPSRTLLVTESMLAAFPIQSLEDADAMVAFSYFPGLLATAAEVYARLEAEIRGAGEQDRVAIYADFAEQMARIERAAHRRLGQLKTALKIEDGKTGRRTPPSEPSVAMARRAEPRG